jgi:hypothetical protein
MIVFDLRCTNGHVFEGWFGSSSAFEEQVARSMVACPICDDRAVAKAVMAPAIGTKSNVRADASHDEIKRTLARLASAQREALSQSTWVGAGFARQARAIHDGTAPAATIHGQATVEEAKSLIEDGVAIAPLLLPVVPPERQN